MENDILDSGVKYANTFLERTKAVFGYEDLLNCYNASNDIRYLEYCTIAQQKYLDTELLANQFGISNEAVYKFINYVKENFKSLSFENTNPDIKKIIKAREGFIQIIDNPNKINNTTDLFLCECMDLE